LQRAIADQDGLGVGKNLEAGGDGGFDDTRVGHEGPDGKRGLGLVQDPIGF
jgi:hypothetical protein